MPKMVTHPGINHTRSTRDLKTATEFTLYSQLHKYSRFYSFEIMRSFSACGFVLVDLKNNSNNNNKQICIAP